MTSRILMTGGVVYSPGSPFATALYLEAGVVGWIGDDGAASVQADSADIIVNLQGALVTPGFVRGVHGSGAKPDVREGVVHVVDVNEPTASDGQWITDLADVASAVDDGRPFSFALGDPPWQVVRAASQTISTRAAFNAHTRGGWRLSGIDSGVLMPGAGAHVAVWRAEDLAVHVPDGRVAAWSTDPRSGTPGLPDLNRALPDCLMTVVAGVIVYSDDSLQMLGPLG